jgi:hypothetical protein
VCGSKIAGLRRPTAALEVRGRQVRLSLGQARAAAGYATTHAAPQQVTRVQGARMLHLTHDLSIQSDALRRATGFGYKEDHESHRQAVQPSHSRGGRQEYDNPKVCCSARLGGCLAC